MSTTVDQRVVQMQFDNKSFERNIASTLTSLDKLNKELQLENGAKGFSNIERASKNVDLSGITTSLDTIAQRFSTMGIIAASALYNLTTTAIDYGKRIGSALLDPIIEGGKKRAINIEQAKFQFKGLGMDVEATMADASYAVDGTAYSLDAAAKVASQLGASGMRAGEQMRSSLRAISGVAAMTGSSYEDIGNVFTKVAGQGRVMGDDLLRLSSRGVNAAATLAKSMGKTEAEVRAMVTAGQIDFQTFADAMDSAFGEHATKANETFTGSLANVKSALARIGAEVATPAMENLKNVFNALMPVINGIKAGLGPVYEWLAKIMKIAADFTVAKLNALDVTQVFTNISNAFSMTGRTGDNLRRIFAGLGAVALTVWDGVKLLGTAMGALLGFMAPVGSALLGVVATLADFVVSMRKSVSESKLFNEIFANIYRVVVPIATEVRDFVVRLLDMASGFKKSSDKANEFGETVSKVTKPATVLGGRMAELFNKATTAIGTFFGELKKLASKGWEYISDFFGGLAGQINLDNIFKVGSMASVGGIIVVAKKLSDLITKIKDGVNTDGGLLTTIFGKEFDLNGIKDSVTGMLDGVTESLNTFQTKLKADALRSLAISIGILSAALFVLSTIEADKLDTALGGMAVLMVEFAIATKAMTKSMASIKVKDMVSTIGLMNGLAAALLIMSAAIKTLSGLTWEELAVGMTGVAGAMTLLIIATKTVNTNSKGMIKSAAAMVIMAVATKELAKAVKSFAQMEWNDAVRGLKIMAVALGETVLAMRLLPKDTIMSSAGLGVLSAALIILSKALAEFAKIPWTDAVRGLKTMAIALTEVVIAINLIPKGTILKSTGFVILASSLSIMAKALASFAELKWTDAVRALKTMGVALAELTIALNLLPKGMMTKATGVLIMASAMNVLHRALAGFASMSWTEIVRGLKALAGGLAILVVAMHGMNGTLGGSAAMVVMTVALLGFVPVLKILGDMKWSEITKGLTALGGGLGIVIAAGYLASGAAGGLIALAGSITLLGVAVLAAGAGVALFSIGLSTLAAVTSTGVAAIITVLTEVIKTIPIFMENLGKGIGAFFKGLATMADDIANSAIIILQAFVKALVESAPILLDGVFELVEAVLDSLIKHIPTIISKLADVIILIIKGLANKMPDFISALVELLMSMFEGAFNAFGQVDTDKLLKGSVALGILTAIMIALGALAGMIPSAMVGVVGLGVLMAELTVVLGIIGAIGSIPGVQELVSTGGDLLMEIARAIGKFVGGLVGGLAEGITSGLPAMGKNLSDFMVNLKPFLDGASNLDKSSTDAVKNLSIAILALTAADVLEGLASWITGGSSIVSFGEDLAKFGPNLKAFGESIKGIDSGVVQSAAIAAKALAEFANNIPNSGGLAEFFAGGNDIDEWGPKLPGFGKHLVAFSKSVKGLDGDVIVKAATSAQALAELANNLPNSGGLAEFFAGGNDIDEWGKKLPSFGKHLTSYSKAVKNVDGDAVVNSANAAKSLAALAKEIPNMGGVVGFFMGENDIDKFGEMLPSFGKNIAKYAKSVKDIDAEAVISSANAGKALAALAQDLPNSGGLVEFFTGSNDIEDFGEGLVEFGEAMASYYKSVKGINVETLAGVSKEVKSLVNIAKLLEDVDMDGMEDFSPALTKMATNGIKNFTEAFTDTKDKVEKAVKSLVDAAGKAIKDSKLDWKQYGSDMAGSFNGGIGTKYDAAKERGVALVTQVHKGITSKKSEMRTAGFDTAGSFNGGIGEKYDAARIRGQELAMKVINGLTIHKNKFRTAGTDNAGAFNGGIGDKYEAAKVRGTALAQKALDGLKGFKSKFKAAGFDNAGGFNGGIGDKYGAATERGKALSQKGIDGAKSKQSGWTEAGRQAGQGFVNGLNEKASSARTAAANMANGALSAAKSLLGIASPSKEFTMIGRFTGGGFVNGLADKIEAVKKISAKLGKTSLDAVTEAVSKANDLLFSDNYNPVITPVIDLDEVNKAINEMDALFANSNTDVGSMYAASIAAGRISDIPIDPNVVPENVKGTQLNFTQINNSPKELSRLEIYQDTKTALEQVKEVI